MCTAAEAIIQNEVMDVIPSLWEQVCLYMMEDPETITYLGNLKKEGCELNAYRVPADPIGCRDR